MIKLMLNTHKFNNYAFFCPVSKLHLTVSSPVGFTNEVTTAILRALKAKTIIDVDNIVDLETGTVKAIKEQKVVSDTKEDKQQKDEQQENQQTVENTEEVKTNVDIVDEIVDNNKTEEKTEEVEIKTTKKTTRKTTKKNK